MEYNTEHIGLLWAQKFIAFGKWFSSVGGTKQVLNKEELFFLLGPLPLTRA